MNTKSLIVATSLALAGLLASGTTLAGDKAEIDANSTKALNQFYALGSMNKQLADKAAGVLIFAKVTKAGIGVGGEYGEGVLRVKGKTADYYNASSASIGLTLGVGEHSQLILFMTQDALDKFRKSDGWSAGGDAAVAVVTKGAGGQYDSDTLSKPILGFVFGQKGLIGDLSFEGTKITKIKD